MTWILQSSEWPKVVSCALVVRIHLRFKPVNLARREDAFGECMDLRKIDALVAEKVMGLKGLSSESGMDCDVCHKPFYSDLDVKPYSSDISAAWEVVEKMKDQVDDGFTVMFDKEEKKWRAGALWWRGYEAAEWWETKSAMAENAPLAICLAALRLVGINPYPTASHNP